MYAYMYIYILRYVSACICAYILRERKRRETFQTANLSLAAHVRQAPFHCFSASTLDAAAAAEVSPTPSH